MFTLPDGRMPAGSQRSSANSGASPPGVRSRPRLAAWALVLGDRSGRICRRPRQRSGYGTFRPLPSTPAADVRLPPPRPRQTTPHAHSAPPEVATSPPTLPIGAFAETIAGHGLPRPSWRFHVSPVSAARAVAPAVELPASYLIPQAYRPECVGPQPPPYRTALEARRPRW